MNSGEAKRKSNGEKREHKQAQRLQCREELWKHHS